MGLKHKRHEVINSDSEYDYYYSDLQNTFQEINGDNMNSFKITSSQKKTNLKLDGGKIKLKNDFETFKNEHASLVNC